jgi:hypothetical protein
MLGAALTITASLALAQGASSPGASPSPASSTPASTPAGPAAPAPASAPSATAAPADAAASAAPPAPADALASLEWLSGCWRGTVNQREFREQWLPAAGGMMIGAGHTVLQARTQDYEYLRLEARADGLYYVALPSGQKEASFRLAGTSRDEVSGADIWTFANVAEGFPQRVVYRRGAEGWLYAGIEGTLNGEARKVLYPMRHVSCETGELIRK